jgi:hypothetical protein
MGARGVHFSLGDLEVERLESYESDDERLAYLEEEIEETYFETRKQELVETDKAWDAIHRCLTDGTLAGATGHPLALVVLGGRLLYAGADYIMALKSPEEVRAMAPLLSAITQATFRAAYDGIDVGDYAGELGDEDFAYTWQNFVELREFWARAAEAGRSVLFTVDQ